VTACSVLRRCLLIPAIVAMTTPSAEAAPQVRLAPLAFAMIEGWSSHPAAGAAAALRRSCREMMTEGRGFVREPRFAGTPTDWQAACGAAAHLPEALDDGAMRRFIEAHFVPFLVEDATRPQGLFTGYYEALARGSRRRHGPYQVPIYRKPADLVGFDGAVEARLGLRYGRYVAGEPRPYFSRAEIEDGALAGRGLELLFVDSPIDAFFIHIQGSGRVAMDDGSVVRLAYAAKSGRPYTAIGSVLYERGALSRDNLSMQALRDWLKGHPAETPEVLRRNQSFIFFREVSLEDPALGPPGAQHVQLTPRRSLAIDRAFWALGTPVWLDTAVTVPGSPDRPFRMLMVAQDTGTAIRGAARGDVFFGADGEAATLAGYMKSPGRMIVLLPKQLAARLQRQAP
jgi:membrane-bound lytic murein transglycosylase A